MTDEEGQTSEVFLSTPSARRATQLEIFGEREYIISIHALREEGDPRSIMRLQVRYNFYPRPPRGGRPWPRSGSRWTSAFLSTPSARRATRSSAVVDGQRAISIHALREEGDTRTRSSSWSITNFYPRPPRGGRLATLKVVFKAIDISIHALREEGDPGFRAGSCNHQPISIHALREEGDSKNRDKISIFKQIIQHSARI